MVIDRRPAEAEASLVVSVGARIERIVRGTREMLGDAQAVHQLVSGCSIDTRGDLEEAIADYQAGSASCPGAR